ncbi:hypothetical protein ABIE88_000574 [Bradyrhizobium diazoefficiens]|uniref:hypothetical protein n=1 Tax=Bradyrhizobium diazoefficiens TaxID=1355477 RepID=UPI003518D319
MTVEHPMCPPRADQKNCSQSEQFFSPKNPAQLEAFSGRAQSAPQENSAIKVGFFASKTHSQSEQVLGRADPAPPKSGAAQVGRRGLLRAFLALMPATIAASAVAPLTPPSEPSKPPALGSTAALPLVTTVPSIASGAASACSRPDLAARFDEFYALWKAQREADAAESAACDAAEREGQAFDWSDPDNERWFKINEGRSQLIDEIMSHRASSLADVVLQARASAMDNHLYWLDQASLTDAGNVVYRQLVDRICEFAGVEAFPGIKTVPCREIV